MQIYISHASGFAYQAELYQPLLNSDLAQQHDIVMPHLTSEEPYLLTKGELQKFDLVIAEVSYPSTGQGIELGWFSWLKIPIVCVFKTTSKYSPALKTVCSEFVAYSTSTELVGAIQKSIGSLAS